VKPIHPLWTGKKALASCNRVRQQGQPRPALLPRRLESTPARALKQTQLRSRIPLIFDRASQPPTPTHRSHAT